SLDHLAVFQIDRLRLDAHANPRRRACGNHITWVQGHELADVGHDGFHSKHHGLGVAVLTARLIHVQPHAQVFDISYLVLGHQPGAKGSKSVGTFALHPLTATLELEATVRHVIDHAVTCYMLQRLVYGYVLG